ncbi:type VII secretion-associated protein [Corynebacterium macginleyi]|uniref:type VII secretion-associated protein n=1 Tax=Corynebacterium macginleyi TaxID=38290 RepID=UPI002D800257|nr:type VII secretion-associated protein [Corynebacterium macginleyi]
MSGAHHQQALHHTTGRNQWTIWEDTGHHMSVGCHTRHNANTVQKAACRMATESMSKK